MYETGYCRRFGGSGVDGLSGIWIGSLNLRKLNNI